MQTASERVSLESSIHLVRIEYTKIDFMSVGSDEAVLIFLILYLNRDDNCEGS